MKNLPEKNPEGDRELMEAAQNMAVQYLDDICARPPFPTADAVRALDGFRESWSQHGYAAREVIDQLNTLGAPGTATLGGGRYFGFVMSGSFPVALAANWLASTWDQNAGGWAMSPTSAVIEEVAAQWLLEAFDLPRDAQVGFVTGSTMANFSAMAAARTFLLKRVGWDLRKNGTKNAPSIRVIASAEQHPTVLKSLRMLGIGQAEVEVLPTDAQGRVIAENLPKIDNLTLVLLQAGNVNSGSFDPFLPLCKWAKAADAWVHVDGAFGLWARSSREKKHLTEGIDLCDSWAVDCHKWLNVPHDAAVYICRHAQAVQDMFGIDAPYLVRHSRREPSNYTPELGRRARGIEIWAALKFLGREGVEALIDQCCRHARRFAEGLSANGYQILNDVVLNQVVATYGSDDQMKRIVERIQADGTCWLGPTHWQGRAAMRISVSSWRTTDEDVERSIQAMVSAKSL